jgi:hypothetical protein
MISGDSGREWQNRRVSVEDEDTELVASRAAELAQMSEPSDIGVEFELAMLELERRFPDVVSLQFDHELNEIDGYDLHNAGLAYHDQFHQAQQFIKETLRPLAKRALYGDKSDSEVAFELMHEAIHKYPKVFSFDTDGQGTITGFRVKYDTKRNSARTIEAAKLYCKRLYEELEPLDYR